MRYVPCGSNAMTYDYVAHTDLIAFAQPTCMKSVPWACMTKEKSTIRSTTMPTGTGHPSPGLQFGANISHAMHADNCLSVLPTLDSHHLVSTSLCLTDMWWLSVSLFLVCIIEVSLAMYGGYEFSLLTRLDYSARTSRILRRCRISTSLLCVSVSCLVRYLPLLTGFFSVRARLRIRDSRPVPRHSRGQFRIRPSGLAMLTSSFCSSTILSPEKCTHSPNLSSSSS